jgi:cleavage and polyadenylation specificity factor subunit 2
MSVISKGRHDIVIKQEGKTSGGFFKVTKKQYPIYPFHEEKIKCDEYGEIIKPEEYKLAEIVPEAEDNKENVVIKKEEEVVRKTGIFGKEGRVECFFAAEVTEAPSKCIILQRTVQVNCQVQYIDFEGRSDGESLMKILSQLRPRRVVIVRGSPESTATIQNHCQENIDARVFAPIRGEIVDATTETHIYQVRLTDALVSQLNFQKAKEAEVAWVNAEIVVRESQLDAKRMNVDNEPMEGKASDLTSFRQK